MSTAVRECRGVDPIFFPLATWMLQFVIVILIKPKFWKNCELFHAKLGLCPAGAPFCIFRENTRNLRLIFLILQYNTDAYRNDGLRNHILIKRYHSKIKLE